MTDLTDFRSKVERKRDEAKEQVKKWEEHLAMIDEVLHGGQFQASDSSILKSQANMVLVSPRKGRKESLVGKIRNFILSIEGEFNARGVALTIQNVFPEASSLDEGARIRKVSSAVWKLKKEGKITIVHKGIGSDPNIYQVSSAKDDFDDIFGDKDEDVENKMNEQ